jgi:hypothetical protein
LMVNKEFWGAMTAVGFLWYSVPVSAETRENSREFIITASLHSHRHHHSSPTLCCSVWGGSCASGDHHKPSVHGMIVSPSAPPQNLVKSPVTRHLTISSRCARL